jgi:phosphate transport system substrate-binding protein
LIALSLFLGCQEEAARRPPLRASVEKVTVSGSAALLPLLTEAANQYMRSHPGRLIVVSPDTERQAERAADEGRIHVAAIAHSASSALEQSTVAEVGIALVANRGSYNESILSLTRRQLRGIVRGEITNWSQLGGGDQRIVFFDHEDGSDSREALARWLGVDRFSAPDAEQVSSWTVQSATLARLGALSYVALPYLHPQLKTFALDGTDPTMGNLREGRYPLWTQERLVLRRDATRAAREFVAFVQSKDLQEEIFDQLGYLSPRAHPPANGEEPPTR